MSKKRMLDYVRSFYIRWKIAEHEKQLALLRAEKQRRILLAAMEGRACPFDQPKDPQPSPASESGQ